MDNISNLQKWAKERGIDKLPPSPNDYIANIVEELGEFREAHKIGDIHGMIDAIADIVVFSVTEMPKFGYDSNLVMLEVYKEINSRVGAYDPELGKWKKDTSPDAVSNWYKAKFEECLIKED